MLLLQLSDPHIGPHPDSEYKGVHARLSFSRVLDVALADEPAADALILTGDLAAHGHPEAYRWLAGTLARIPLPVYCLPGNHDDPEAMRSLLTGGRVRAPEYFDLGPWRVVCGDSTRREAPDGYLSPAECARIDAALGARPEAYSLVALHHHPIQSGSAWLDALCLTNPEDLFAVLVRHARVRGVIFGHVHQVIDEFREGLRFLSCPSSCIQFMPRQRDFTVDVLPPGYRKLRLRDDGAIETEVVSVPFTA